MIPMHTPIEKNIYPTASAHTDDGISMPGVPFKYLSIPLLAPSRVKLLMSMMTMNRSGIGTVNHTMYDELCTPLKTAPKQASHTNKVAKKAGTENWDGSPSSKSLQLSSLNLITSISKNCYAGVIFVLSHFQTKSVLSFDHGSGSMKEAMK